VSDQDDVQTGKQGDSCPEKEEESNMEEGRDARLNEEEIETRSPGMRMQTEYVIVDKRQKRTDMVTRGDDKGALIEEQVLEVSTRASIQEMRTSRNAVAFSKQLGKLDHIENTAPNTPKVSKVPRKKAPALDTGNYKFLASSQPDDSILARQQCETGELTFRLIPQTNTV